ncbi:MAG: tetratricopeptide repeat protein, partial [Desulfarculaceae bacterium]
WTILTGSRKKASLRKAQKFLTSGRQMEAVELFRKITREWPDQPDGYKGMCHAYKEMGFRDEAVREAVIAKSLITLERQPNDLPARVALADAFLDRENFGWAATHAGQALRLAPDDEKVMLLAAKAFAANRNHQRAIGVLRKLVKINPLDQELWDQLTASLSALGRASQALKMDNVAKALQEAGKEPQSDAALEKAVRRLLSAGKKSMALELLETHLHRFEHSANLHRLLGEVLMALSKYGRATEALEQALILEPANQRTHTYMAKALQMKGDQELAAQHAAVAKTLSSGAQKESSAPAELAIARILLDRGNTKLVLNRAAHLEQKNPQDWRSPFLKGLVLSKHNKAPQALRAFQKACELNDKVAEIHIEMAKMYSQGGQKSIAVAEAKKAANLVPRDPHMRRELANILKIHGHMEKAMEEEELAESLSKSQDNS